MFIKFDRITKTRGPLGTPVFTDIKYVIAIPAIGWQKSWQTTKCNDTPGVWVVFFALASIAAGIFFVAGLVLPAADKVTSQWILVGFILSSAIAVLLFGHNVLNKS